jgi:hypothetical protein
MSDFYSGSGGFNRPQSPFLPNVKSGVPLTQRDVQQLTEGIDRSTLKAGSGVRLRTGTGGTTIEVLQDKGSIGNVPPWCARWINDHSTNSQKALAIKVGKVYNGYYDFFDSQSGSYLRAGIFKTNINGRKDDIWSVKHELERTITFDYANAKTGHWYLEPVQVTDSKGKKVRGYELKIESNLTHNIPYGSLLLFSIASDKSIIQHANSDLFDNTKPRSPFQVYRTWDTKISGYVYKIEAGAVCGIIPTYGGSAIGSDMDGFQFDDGGKIYLRLTATGSGTSLKFPNAVTVEKGSTIPSDDKNNCYIPIAIVGSDSTVTQTVSGCLWAERLRWSQKTVYRFWRV